MQLTVIKSDGSREVYLHTKVMGSISAALEESDDYSAAEAEQMAEAITSYLRRRYRGGLVNSDEIHSMVEVVLYDSCYDEAALCLNEHRLRRQIQRNRTEVINYDGQDNKQSDFYAAAIETQPWDKSIIVQQLENQKRVNHKLARVVAGRVEEKVLQLGFRRLTSSLVKELVRNELRDMLQAETALTEPSKTKKTVLLSMGAKQEVTKAPENCGLAAVGGKPAEG